MADGTATFSANMGPLIARYLDGLSARMEDIKVFLAACEADTVDAALMRIMRRHAHSLSGSGLTYGFADISIAGQKVERLIDDELTGAELIQPLKDLLAAMGKAVASKQHITPAAEDEKKERERKPILLIVDDDPAIRDLVENLFKRDARILVAVDGEEALRLIEEYKPDLVIMDNNMPGRTGVEVLESVRLKPELAQTPIILLTANNDPKDIMRGVMTGALDYIVKPFDPQQLVQKIRDRLQRQRYTILIADDDPSIGALLEHKFRTAGCRVLLAKDGPEAIELANTANPSLLILDRMMPGLDGVAVLQSLRSNAQTRHVPILFLTAKRQEQDILEGFRLGAADYVVKPFRPEELLARSFRLLAGQGGM